MEVDVSEENAPTDWAADVKRYARDADDGVIAAIVRYCGIALRTRDASLVSFGDPAEIARVRENYCRKKLALEDSDDVINAAIASVGERMSDTPYRNRVTVYYLLAEHFGKLGVFGGAAPAPAAVPVAAAAPLAAAVPLAAAAPVAAATDTARRADDGFGGFAFLVFAGAVTILGSAAIAGSYIAGRFDTEEPAAPAAPVAAAPVAAPAIPEGAGIVSEVVEGRPKVSVYFAVGASEIAPDFAAAAAPVREWLEANPGDRVQLSGFTDPTGNAAANAALAKNRAQAVAAALEAQGIASDRIDLVKPADSSDETVDLSSARRVEITVTPG